ncbi:MAG: IPT/TIG domain-containing protein [Planctomycetes bacterium]|nr:IPT/TIG domain-containing protein [Planctomycetota bacterium]
MKYMGSTLSAVFIHLVFTAALPAGLVSRWTFDGHLRDTGGSGNDGAFTGGGAPTYVADHEGAAPGAIQLDGIDEYVRMAYTRGLPIYSQGQYSVVLWIKGSPQRSRSVFAEGSTATRLAPQIFSIGPDSSGATGKVDIWLRDDRGVPMLNHALSEGVAFDGKWHCIVWTDDFRRGALYIDGIRDRADFNYSLVDAGALTLDYTVVSGIFTPPTDCCFFEGAVGDVQVYDHVLSQTEIDRLCPPPPPPCPSVTLASVNPPLVSSLGGTTVTISASGLQSGHTAKVGGAALENPEFVTGAAGGITGIRGNVPALPAGFHDVQVLCASGEVAGTLARAVEAAPPPQLSAVAPSEVFSDGTTRLVIRGANFRAETKFMVGAHEMINPAVDPSTATGFAPDLDAGERLGPRDVSAEDSRGMAVLRGAVTYVAPPDPCAPARRIDSVMPSLVSSQGGTGVDVHGAGFLNGDTARVGGKPLEGQSLIDPGGGGAPFIRGAVPALAEGFHTAEVVCVTGRVVASLPRAVEAAPPPVLRRVAPAEVSTKGGTPVTVRGANFRSVTVVRFGPSPLLEPQVTADGTSITGYAPPLAAGGGAGAGPVTVDVTAEDSRGVSGLRGAVTYIVPPVLLPGPDEIEASLAEGTARFSWFNPVAYDEIMVLDANDQVMQVLSGDATSLELPAPGVTKMGVKLKGKVSELLSDAALALAAIHQCERPPPLMWGGEPCNYTPEKPDDPIPICARVLSLDGNHAAATLTRCTAPSEGGGGGGEPTQQAQPFVPYFPRGAGAGGGAVPAIRPGHGGHGGAAPGFSSKGYMVQNEFLLNPLIQLGGNALITGFILEEPADKLEIAGYYEKLATAFGLELHVLIECIFPPENAYKDEFTMPDVPIHAGRNLNCITYFRADKDIGHPGNPNDPDPAKQPPRSCQVPLPPGEYRLSFYAVGGNAKIQYYTFATDQHDNEILIQGVPCPPYPLVKITDLTGLRTLPDITNVEAKLPDYSLIQKFAFPCSGIRVRFTAHGLWLDENNMEHAVPPVTPSDDNPHFEYKWTVHDRPNPTAKITGKSPILNYCVTDWGCYKVDIEVRDLQCGFVKTRTYEVPIRPNWDDVVPPCPNNVPFTFLYPTPDPGGMYGVVGLKTPNAPLGPGFFDGTRPVSFRVLVVPECYCDDADDSDCPAACLDTDPSCQAANKIEFRLAWKNGNTYQKVEGVQIEVKDLCPNVPTGAKYFAVDIKDLGAIAPQQGWLQKKPYDVFFQGRRKQADPDSGWRNVGETADPLKALKLFTRPSVFDEGFWNGHFIEGDQSYHFVAKTANDTEENAPLGPSNEIDLGLPAVDVSVPSYQNNVSSGFTSRFMMLNGVWGPEVGAGTTSGEVVSNKMDGAPVEVVGTESTQANLSPEGGGGASLPVYEWCRGDEIVNESISQTLFESILYTGTIWVIPVTIWGRVGLGLDIFIASHALIRLAPFAALEGDPTVQAEFSLDSSVKLSIPCEISADILGGVLSIAFRLIPSATFILKANVGALDAEPHVQWFAEAFLDLLMQIEGCLNLLITEACLTFDVPILEHETLISSGQCFPIPTCDDDDVPITPCDGGGGVVVKEEKVGGGAGAIQFELPYQSISAPVTVFSPDKKTLMEIYFDEQGLSTIQVNGAPAETSLFGVTVADLLNPAAAFVSNTAVVIAWTDGYCSESGLTQHCFPDPMNPPPPPTLAQMNLMQAQQEIVVSTLVFKVEPPWVDPRWILEEKFRIADPIAEVPDPANRRTDGMAAIAADPSELSDNPPGGEAIVAWVRYDGDFLKLDGTKTIYKRLPNGQTQSCPSKDPNQPPKTCRFQTQTVDNFRPQMELTAIYARRVSLSGVIQGENKVKLSPPGINVEPAVALSPTGQVGYCVWVYDPTPMTGHVDLTESNKGRQLLFSVYSKATNTWSAPASVLPNLGDYDAKYPGVLEPHMALKDNQNGLLAFTAVKSNAPENDSGLAGSRFVYGCRLVNGVFGTPFLIHGKCLRRVYGWKPQVVIDIPEIIDPLSKLKLPIPEEIIVFQQTDQVGLLAGSGNEMVAPIMKGLDLAAPAKGLKNDGNIHSNVSAALAGGMLCTLSLNSGKAQLGFGGAAGGGLPRTRQFESTITRLEPDLAITGCRLSDPFSAPGSKVTASVDLENLGLAGTPYDDQGRSAVGLEALFVSADGRERVAAAAPVPVLRPGEATQLKLALEMPHEPVRVRVRLNPNPIDSGPENNSRECLFGAPAPRDLLCQRITVDGEPPRPAAKLTWKNAGLYDEICLYRNGSMFASLPGACAMFVDLYAPESEVTYCVRGRMGASKSTKTACRLLPPGTPFRRGFVNDDSQDDISDDITILGYKFLGNPARLLCEKAADNNDDGEVDITDAVWHLIYKFIGGPPPAAPYASCGLDMTLDNLTCERAPGCP